MKTIFMTREQHEKWDKALRSGDYTQGGLSLRARATGGGYTYCCLGVLQHCLTGEVEMSNMGMSLSLPTCDWLDSHNITFVARDRECSNSPYLPVLNSSADKANDVGVSFVKIADAIMECVEYTDEKPSGNSD